MKLVDTEAMVVEFFAPTVAPDHVGTKVKSPRPKRFVRAYRTGGAASNRILERAQITVTAEAESSTAASELASKCRHDILNNYTRMPLVRGVEEITGLYFDPDPGTGNDRYTFTVALTVRAKR